MIEKPKQYYDTRCHQLYYQWDESEYFVHQEPIYNRTREYIEALEAENTKLWIFAKLMHGHIKECCDACGERGICDVDALASELGIEVKQ